MKKFVAFLVMLTVGGTLLAQTPAPAPATPTPTPTPVPAPPAKPGAKPDAKKPVPEPKIDGFVITRSNGTFLGLTIVEGKFHVTCYDKKKKPMVRDFDRVLARWPNVHGNGDNRSILNPVGPNAVEGNQFVRGPYVFRLTLTLLRDTDVTDKDQSAETYVVNYSG